MYINVSVVDMKTYGTTVIYTMCLVIGQRISHFRRYLSGDHQLLRPSTPSGSFHRSSFTHAAGKSHQCILTNEFVRRHAYIVLPGQVPKRIQIVVQRSAFSRGSSQAEVTQVNAIPSEAAPWEIVCPQAACAAMADYLWEKLADRGGSGTVSGQPSCDGLRSLSPLAPAWTQSELR